MKTLQKRILLSCALMGLAGTVSAQIPPNACRGTDVYFSDRVSTEVESDQLVAGLFVEKQQNTPIALNQVLNRISQQVSQAIQSYKPDVIVQTTNYDTWPVYDDKRKQVIGWRGRLNMKLVGPLNDRTRKAIQAMQQYMTLSSLKPTVSAEKRKALRDELEVKLLKQAWQRLNRYGQALNAASVRLVEVNMRGSTRVQPVYEDAVSVMAMRKAAAPTAPVAVEGGQQQVSVSASFKGCLLPAVPSYRKK